MKETYLLEIDTKIQAWILENLWLLLLQEEFLNCVSLEHSRLDHRSKPPKSTKMKSPSFHHIKSMDRSFSASKFLFQVKQQQQRQLRSWLSPPCWQMLTCNKSKQYLANKYSTENSVNNWQTPLVGWHNCLSQATCFIVFHEKQ